LSRSVIPTSVDSRSDASRRYATALGERRVVGAAPRLAPDGRKADVQPDRIAPYLADWCRQAVTQDLPAPPEAAVA
jgi:hypothetical protein